VFLRELRLDFEDKRYAYDETWQGLSKEFQQKGLSLTGKLPALDIDGHILTQVRACACFRWRIFE
jgi:glutathione S-transferase